MASKIVTTEEFIQRSQAIHGEKYDYSKAEYIKQGTKTTIICKDHGPFQQCPSSHMAGRGCFECSYIERGDNRTQSQDDVIKRFVKAHDNKYDYSLVEFVNARIQESMLM